MHNYKKILAVTFFALVLLCCKKKEPPFAIESMVYKIAGVHTWTGTVQIKFDSNSVAWDSLYDVRFSDTIYALNDTTFTCWDSLDATQDTFHLDRTSTYNKLIPFYQNDYRVIYGCIMYAYLVSANYTGYTSNWEKWHIGNSGRTYRELLHDP